MSLERNSRRAQQREPPSETIAPRRKPQLRARVLPPLWLVAAGFLFFLLAYVTYGPGAQFGNLVYPIWSLCAGLGLIAVSGGLVAIYAGPDPPSVGLGRDADASRYAVVPRTEYDLVVKGLEYQAARTRHDGHTAGRKVQHD